MKNNHNTLARVARYYFNFPGLKASRSDRLKLAHLRTAVQETQEKAAIIGRKASPNSKAIKQYKAALPLVLPFDIFSIILGHMLGDCTVKYNNSKDKASIAFEWGNKAYAYHVYNLLNDYVLSPPREQVRVNASGNKVVTYCFQTVTLSSLTVYKDLFIKDNIKTVPTGLIKQLLTPLALAIWYIDDGGLTDYRKGHGQGLQLNTQCFTIKTVEQMVLELNEKYQLNCWLRVINRKNGQPIIVIPSQSYSIFYDLVKKYIHVSQLHKLPKPKNK